MGRTPDLKRVTAEDFPKESQALVRKLGFIINSFHEQVRNVLNKNIDFDNLNQEIIVLSFSTNQNNQPLNQLNFKSNLKGRIQGMSVVKTVITSSNTQFAETLPILSWNQSGNLVTITHMGGLLPETGYELTILTI